MPNPMIRIHNTETDQVIDREMTKEEFAQHKADKVEATKIEAEQLAKEDARKAALQKLTEIAGLTQEELASIL
jgi:hypothetical protein